MGNMLKSKFVLRAIGKTLATYFKFVSFTGRHKNQMQPFFDEVDPNLPSIFTFWHGEQFLLPGAVAGHVKVSCLVSRHGDGEVQAAAMEAFGMPTIRGSGGANRAKTLKKGGVQGMLEMISCLESGSSIGMTAQVPRGPARTVGKGVVTLAKLSGRPVYPIVMVTHRNIVLDTWDQAVINLPFSKVAFGLGKPIWIDGDADEEELERARLTVETELVRITKEARHLVGASS